MSKLKNGRFILFITIFIFFILIYCIVFLPEETFLHLVEEDGLLESIAAILFFLTAIFFLFLFFRIKSFSQKKDQLHFNTLPKRIFFLLLALLFIVLCGEEISWGQRILGFDTPQHIKDRNMQEEFNFHNLDIFNLTDKEANKKTGIAKYLTAKKIFTYVFILYLFIIPLSVRLSQNIKKLTNKFFLPIPEIGLGILFILNILLFKAYKPFAQGDDSILRGLAEVEEFNFTIILFLLPFIWFGWLSKPSKRAINIA